MSITDEIAGLWINVLNTEHHIDRALDTEDPRAFRVWCKKRASQCARVQRLLIALLGG